jgi:beta-N-acetylhexosaminidase
MLGQSLLVGFHGPTVTPDLEALITHGQIGGVILFATNGNIETPGQVAALCNRLQTIAREAGQPGLLIAVDQEGGRVARLTERAGFSEAPSAMAVAASGDPANARIVAQILARELRAVGVNVNLAPVMDVNNNRANPVIGTRSYGQDPARVAAFGVATVAGLQAERVLAVAKHFPGHGDTDVDSHIALPRVPHGRDRLEAIELPPFRAAIEAGVTGIMSAHVTFPAVDPSGLPATLSAATLNGLLRTQMGFTGLITTDSLEMGALSASLGLSPAEAAEHAYLAGADLLLFNAGHDHHRAAHERLQRAAADGRITPDRIIASAARIAHAKAWLDLAAQPLVDSAAAADQVGTRDHQAALDQVARAGITHVGPALPRLTPAAALVIETPAGAGLGEALGARTEPIAFDPDADAIDALRHTAAHVEHVLVVTDNAGRHPGQAALIRALTADGRRLIVIAARDPYDLVHLPPGLPTLCLYACNPPMLRACVRVLQGRHVAPGVLPVAVRLHE